MAVTVEKLENNEAKITFEVAPEVFDQGIEKAYQKNKGRFNIPGFRKGKAPRKFVEKMYGVEIFYEEALNNILPDSYEAAYEEASKEIEIVSRPEIDVEKIEKGEAVVISAKVALAPVVTLGEYKGIEVEKLSVEVTDEEVADELKKVQEANSRTVEVTDRAVEDGDIATIDFEGFVDGVAFEGGKGTDYKLGIGTHSFIDTFEDQIIGHNTADEFDVNVTFPEEYGVADLAGKPATFKVAVKKIEAKEYPELDDEFASEVSDFETMAEYKESVKKDLAEKKQQNGMAAREDEVVKKIVENSQISYSSLQVKDVANNRLTDMKRGMQQQGISMEMYLQYTGMTEQQLLEQQMPEAEDRIKARAVLLEIAKAENIVATEEEIDKKYQEIADQYKMELDKVKEALGATALDDLKKDLQVEKAVDLVVAAAVEK